MGVFKKMMIEFLTNRTNLTILQCVLYIMVGYIMGEHLSNGQLILMFALMLGIQMITRIKAIADGVIMMKIIENNLNDYDGKIKKMDNTINKITKKFNKKDSN
tara:strand:- start:324 stop:632 length:309 start_codon:yes stop_codon:yes gene_type:complete